MRTTHDAVIVGAGPAGSSAAIWLARAGWSVALVEKQGFPRRKVCGECIAASNLPLLDALGVGDAVVAAAPELQQVTLCCAAQAVTAALPAAEHPRHRWGRALGRETLDTLLRDAAVAAGAVLLQPWRVSALRGSAGAWHCDLRAVDNAATLSLRTPIFIDAHGSWEALPMERPQRGQTPLASDLLAFKANFTETALRPGTISVLALNGGYGGMVVADGGASTVACCIRRDRLHALRVAAPGVRAGDAVEAWLQGECAAVRAALHGAQRDGPWLASGPLAPGVRVHIGDGVLRIGNAAGEAHPILGEGMSLALQSAALQCGHLLAPPGRAGQQDLQRRYAADWQSAFAPRLRLAAAFAHAAMRPASAGLLMAAVRAWPGLLTHGARWGGKVQTAHCPTPTAVPRRPSTRPSPETP